MGMLTGGQIKRLVESRDVTIEPFDPRMVMPATYDLRLGEKILASPLGPDILGTVVELSETSPTYPIQTGQMVAIISAERLKLPLDFCGRFGIRSEYARKGLISFGGLQVDPGFRGHLVMMLQNVGPEPVPLTVNEPIFSVEFHRLEEAAEAGYSGEYQDQNDFPSDQYIFILSAHTTSLAEIPKLRRQIEQLQALVRKLEKPRFDQGDSFQDRWLDF